MTGGDELEVLLRRALAERAEAVEPAGDGLRRIRERTAVRHRPSRWRVPALALAGAAAVVAALVLLPSLLPDLRPAPGGSPAAGPGHVSPTSPTSPTSPAATTIPGAGVGDLVTVWPYPSRRDGYERAEQDIAAGAVPDLTRPDLAAVRFVRSYLGSGPTLTAVSAGRWKAGLRMELRRDDTPVSLVYLVRVRIGDDAPYVVVNAVAPGDRLTLVPVRDPGGTLTAGGTVPADAGTPRVQLREPGRDEPLAAARGTVAGTGWEARLTSPAPLPPTVAVAAWTVGADGVTAFVATPG